MALLSRFLPLASLALTLVSPAAGSSRGAVVKPLTPYVQALHARRPSVIGGLLRARQSCASGFSKCSPTTCCPNGTICCAGGECCSAGTYCDGGGCCPLGKLCQTTFSDSVSGTTKSSAVSSGSKSAGKPSPVSSSSVGAGSITPPPSASASNTSGVNATSHVSSNHIAVITVVVCSLVGVALLLCLIFFFIHRHRLKRRPPLKTLLDPMLNVGRNEQQPFQPSSKSALDLEMHRAHRRLQALRHELQAQPQTGAGAAGTNPSSVGSQNENAELRTRIQTLTEEVERLRSMGAEPPPAYSIQD
ncbi:hypothetical protein B0H19DRAFT_1259153 [Mycena capillaripes]|nr:hypothetical protein B0H19DRAFT_1259153 [Mycena capillaripes]